MMNRRCPNCHRMFPSDQSVCPDCTCSLIAVEDGDLVGQVLDDRYKVVSKLGQGGMGTLYVASQLSVNRQVALKVLRRDVVQGPKEHERFRREAEAIAALKNEHTVTLFDSSGSTPDGLAYYAMELLDGKPLSQLIRECGTMDYLRAIGLVAQACESLEEAHASGIIHRDIKPDNLFVCTRRQQEHVKVLDFGIAKFMGERSADSLTTTGTIGTPLYMSPEQAAQKAIGPSSDLYSLAVVLYELLAGEPPFKGGKPMDVILRHIHEKPVPIRGRNSAAHVPAKLDEFVLRGLAKKPNDRIQTAAAFRKELTIVLDKVSNANGAKPDPALATTESSASPPNPGRHRFTLLGVAILIAGAVFLAVWNRWLGPAADPNLSMQQAPRTDMLSTGDVAKQLKPSNHEVGETTDARLTTSTEGTPHSAPRPVETPPDIRDLLSISPHGRLLADTHAANDSEDTSNETASTVVGEPQHHTGDPEPVESTSDGSDATEQLTELHPTVSIPDPQTGISWVLVPGGTFIMGSRHTRAKDDEKPRHKVTIDAFEVSRTEVTVAQYQKCIDTGPCTVPGKGGRCYWGRGDVDTHPVTCISWDQAAVYAKWAGARLPTEAEWEYAARSGGKDWTYAWGDESATCGRAVMNDHGLGCGRGEALEVCSIPPGNTSQGLCDMVGNVEEFVQDFYQLYSRGERWNPQGPKEGLMRIARGGSWRDVSRDVRATKRHFIRRSFRSADLGFRVVRPAPAHSPPR